MEIQSKIKKEIKNLRIEIQDHSYKYYVENDPVISDKEFDSLYSRLVNLEKEFPELITPESPTQRVGSETDKSIQTS